MLALCLGMNANPKQREQPSRRGGARDESARDQPAGRKRERRQDQTPAGGPHDKKELADTEKTPGAGTLPRPGSHDDSTSG